MLRRSFQTLLLFFSCLSKSTILGLPIEIAEFSPENQVGEVTEFSPELGDQDKTAFWRDAYNIPISFKLIENEYMPKSLASHENMRNLRDIINRAFDLWASSGDIRFIEVSQDEDAEIKILFVPTDHRNRDGSMKGIPKNSYHCHFGDSGRSGTLAHAYYPPAQSTQYRQANRRTDPHYKDGIQGDLHFDMHEDWTYHDEDKNGRSIFSTAVHELGHSLGFSHVKDPDSIMFAFARHGKDSNKLSDYDKVLIRTKYNPPKNFWRKNWIVFVMIGFCVLVIGVYKSFSHGENNLIRKDNRYVTRKI